MSILLKAEQLAFAYGDLAVLESVDLELAAGEFVGLIGANGSGKTTLLHVLLHLFKPDRGQVRLEGRPLSQLSRRDIARRATLVPQDTHSDFAFSVRELAAMGRMPHLGRFQPERPIDTAAIDQALEVTQTALFSERLLSELSGGERQRVQIARAIAQQTPVLLLDEPTASLDLEHQLQLMELIRILVKDGKGVIAALHDLNLAARYCDRLLVLGDKRVVLHGRPSEVITEEALATHFRIRARVESSPDTGGVVVVPLAPL